MEFTVNTDDIEDAISTFADRGRDAVVQAVEVAQDALEQAKSSVEPRVQGLVEQLGGDSKPPAPGPGRFIAIAAVVVGLGVGLVVWRRRRHRDHAERNRGSDAPAEPAAEFDGTERWSDEGGATTEAPADDSNPAASPQP